MSKLLEGLRGRGKTTKRDGRDELFRSFGVLENPFPPASKTAENPHMELSADEKIVDEIKQFQDGQISRVIVIEGDQGVGKTNMLSFYHAGLRDIFEDEDNFYVVRYFSDLEPSFDGVLRRIIQELGAEHLHRLASALEEDESPLKLGRSRDFRTLLKKLVSLVDDGDHFDYAANLAVEWLTGHRVLNRHRDELGVKYRLDTLESKTEAFRDLVEISNHARVLDGIFLLMDELEKLDATVPMGVVLRYLFALRALIDALPRHLFLMIALTITARRRYSQMVPALSGRMQNVITLQPLKTASEAIELYDFYQAKALQRATKEIGRNPPSGALFPIDRKEAVGEFESLLSQSRTKDGVTPRDFLNRLHERARDKMFGDASNG